MEPRLLDLLFHLQQGLGLARPYEVISAYRSPQSNALLRQISSGVAQKSLHMARLAFAARPFPRQMSTNSRRAASTFTR